jgi:peptidoglycan-associated lipoprotein
MKNNIGFKLLLLVIVAAVMATVSCAKKTSVPESVAVSSAITDEEAAKKKAAADRIAEEERQRAIQSAKLAEAKAAAAALYKFENENIQFAFDSWELSPAAQALLKSKAAYLSAIPSVSVTIEGHCDERGTTDYNLALGDKRARAAKSFLVDLGIQANRIRTISYGEEKPLDPGKNEAAYAINRRAQFVVSK